MIANTKDLTSALNYIETENTLYPDKMQDKMDAAIFNTAFRRIESQLNELYEKIRQIEEVDAFCRTYVKSVIEVKEEKLRESLKIIQDAASTFQDKRSVAVLVPFIGDNTPIRDRDGSVIGRMSVKNERLEMQSDVLGEATFSAISSVPNVPRYNNSYQRILLGHPGTSFYSLQKQPEQGIKEDVVLTLSRPSECNYLAIHEVNCTAQNIRVVDEQGREYAVPSSGYFEPKKITHVLFCLHAVVFTKEKKVGDVVGYDDSGAFGRIAVPEIDAASAEQRLIKQMEISQAESNKHHIIENAAIDCAVWSKINKSRRQKNVMLAGD